MDFSLIIGSLPIYFSGLWTTVWLVGLSLVIGLSIAIPLAIARNSRNYVISTPAWGYIYFFRGTPLLVQLYLIYYGMDQFFPVKGTLWENAWFCALVAFVLNTSAYTAEIIRGAINGLPKVKLKLRKHTAWGLGKPIVEWYCQVHCAVRCQPTVTK